MTIQSTNTDLDIRHSDFALSSPLDDYIQLSPVGLFSHARGVQQVDKPALQTLVKNFNSFFSRLGRRFADLPFYVGHPDVSGFENTYTDRKAYGWIMDLQLRDDGLYGKTKWTDAGRQLIAGGHYKFLSPTWTAEKSGSHNGRTTYRPTHLVSVGLTNEPNLPVLPLANSSDCAAEPATLLGEPLPLPDLREAPQPKCQMKNAHLDSRREQPNLGTKFEAGLGTPCSMLNENHPGLALSNSSETPPTLAENRRLLDLELRLKSMEQNLANCERDLATVQSQLIASVLDNAIASARILPAERKLWQSQLLEDFHNASAALANTKPQIKQRSPQTTFLGQAERCQPKIRPGRKFAKW